MIRLFDFSVTISKDQNTVFDSNRNKFEYSYLFV